MAQPPYAEVTSVEDQLVVALQHERLVRQALGSLDRPVSVVEEGVDRDRLLGLTLLPVDGSSLRAYAEAHHDEEIAARHGGTDSGQYALDVLLTDLYRDFEKRPSRWVPTMGKNRALTQVEHNIDGGGEGAPAPWSPRRGQQPARRRRPEVGVAIADTAVYPHEWFDGVSVAADGLLPRTAAHQLDYTAGHGTFVAGAVLREAPTARLELFTCLGEDGTADSWDVAKRLVTVAGTGVAVLNMSFGCMTWDDKPPLVLATAVDRMDAEMVLVAAAGNHGAAEREEDRTRPLFPAALDDVLAVGATDREGARVDWSPDPAVCPWIDVLAWGVDVESTFLPQPVRMTKKPTVKPPPSPDRFARWSGTSFAAARLSGAIAHVVSTRGRSPRDAAALLLDGLEQRADLPWLPDGWQLPDASPR